MTLRNFCAGAFALAFSAVPAEAQIGTPGVSGTAPVVSVSTTCPAAGPSYGAVTLTPAAPVSISASSDPITAADCGKYISFSNASGTAVSLPAAPSLGANFSVTLGASSGAGAVTVNSAGGNFSLNGGTNLTFAAGQSLTLLSDGTNWQTTGIAGSGSSGSLPTNPSFNSLGTNSGTAPINLIVDDDFVDSQGPMLVSAANYWHDQGVVNLLAVVVDVNAASNTGGGASMSKAISNYYGHTPLIGVYKGTNATARAAWTTVAPAFGVTPVLDSGYTDCVTVYRTALAAAANASVEIRNPANWPASPALWRVRQTVSVRLAGPT